MAHRLLFLRIASAQYTADPKFSTKSEYTMVSVTSTTLELTCSIAGILLIVFRQPIIYLLPEWAASQKSRLGSVGVARRTKSHLQSGQSLSASEYTINIRTTRYVYADLLASVLASEGM